KHKEDKKMNEYRDLWTRIFFLVIDKEKTFPGIVRRMEIKEKKEVLLNPVENAIKNIEDRCSEITELIISHQLDAVPDTNKLSMMLNGVIDAAVMGGVAKYLDAFFVSDFVKQNPSKLYFQICLSQ